MAGQHVDDDFDMAVDYVSNHFSELDEQALLKLYGFFKQAKLGRWCDQSTKPSWVFDLRARAKRKAWSSLGDMAKSTAMRKYVETVTKAAPNWKTKPVGGKEAGNGVFGNWISVSAMAKAEEKTAEGVFDWLKDGDMGRVKECSVENLNARDENGLSLLHWACDRGNTEAVEYLIDIGKIDVNCRDNDNQTPLHYAASCGHLTVCEMLLDSKADCEAADIGSSTPADVTEDAAILELFSKYNNRL